MKEVTSLHTFGIRSFCQDILFLKSAADLSRLADLHESQTPWLVIGEGSNVLFVDDYQGVLVCNQMSGLQLSEFADSWVVEACAGENWHQLVAYLVSRGIGGLENLALIPSSVGAAPVQNIGAYGVEFCQFCEWVEVWDVQHRTFKQLKRSECQFDYRDSCFKSPSNRHWVVTKVGLKLPKNWQPQLAHGPLQDLQGVEVTPAEIFQRVCAIRQTKLPDPTEQGNAGSFFKNPIIDDDWINRYQGRYPKIPLYPVAPNHYKVAAGWLIDQCGLKDYREGGAAVHPHQALVLTNHNGQATGSEITRLASHIRQQVWKQFEVKLEPEVLFIGAQGKVAPEEVLESLC